MSSNKVIIYKLAHPIRNKKQLRLCLQPLPDKIYTHHYKYRDNDFMNITEKPMLRKDSNITTYCIDVPRFINYRWIIRKVIRYKPEIIFLFMIKSVHYTPMFVADINQQSYDLQHFVNPKVMKKMNEIYDYHGMEFDGSHEKNLPLALKNLFFSSIKK